MGGHAEVLKVFLSCILVVGPPAHAAPARGRARLGLVKLAPQILFLKWCTCVRASARQSRAQCRARELGCKILCCKILFLRQFAPVSSLSAVRESRFV